MGFTAKEVAIIRSLAAEVAEIAALPVQQETMRLWRALNARKPERPMAMIDQLPWNEMNVDDELTVLTEDPFCRKVEWQLREILYRWRHIRADMVVEPFLRIGKVISSDGFGIKVQEDVAVFDPGNSVVGHHYVDQLATEEDLARIRPPEVTLDQAATDELEGQAREILGCELPVRMTGASTCFSLWDILVTWHGAEQSLLDLADRPEFMHQIMRRLTDAYLTYLDQLEACGGLEPAQPLIHCCGAWTDELPAPGFDPDKPRAKDAWTCGMAQIFSSVSPAMHEAFEIEYAKDWFARFGLGYYGCCEPLHNKIDIIRRLPNIRKISVSPWADVALAAERIGGDYVLSRKPNPAFLAIADGLPGALEEIRATLDACRQAGTPSEYILKDISTVGYCPQRVWAWEEQTMNLLRS